MTKKIAAKNKISKSTAKGSVGVDTRRVARNKKSPNVPPKVIKSTIYWPDHIDEVRAIAMRTDDDEEMAALLGVKPELLESWKAYYPRFELAIEEGRTHADGQVVGALFKNAIGYDYEDDVVVRSRRGAEIIRATTHVPGETNAQKFWLQNRQPDKWNRAGATLSHTSPKGSPVLVKVETKEEVIHSILNMIAPQPDTE